MATASLSSPTIAFDYDAGPVQRSAAFRGGPPEPSAAVASTARRGASEAAAPRAAAKTGVKAAGGTAEKTPGASRARGGADAKRSGAGGGEAKAPAAGDGASAARETPVLLQLAAWTTNPSDRAFYVSRRNGQLAAAASLWLGIAGVVVTALALGPMPVSPAAAAGASVAVGFGVYALLTVVLTLTLNHALERKVTEIRRTARIGCERMRIDDAPLMRAAIRDVLSEWMHINFFVRHLREASAVAGWAFVAQSALTIAATASLAPMAPGGFWMGVALIGAPIALSLGHVAYHLRLLGAQVRAAAIKEDDPTEVLATRMVSLLDEVKALRKPLARA